MFQGAQGGDSSETRLTDFYVKLQGFRAGLETDLGKGEQWEDSLSRQELQWFILHNSEVMKAGFDQLSDFCEILKKCINSS